MAKKAKKATAKKAPKRAAARPAPRSSGFKALAMHITEENGRRTFAALKADRPADFVFSHPASQPEVLDSESAAKRILAHAFASHAMPSLAAPEINGDESNFKSLGVETVPLAGTRVVKFRQQVMVFRFSARSSASNSTTTMTWSRSIPAWRRRTSRRTSRAFRRAAR
jgi:hypothetical protein